MSHISKYISHFPLLFICIRLKTLYVCLTKPKQMQYQNNRNKKIHTKISVIDLKIKKRTQTDDRELKNQYKWTLKRLSSQTNIKYVCIYQYTPSRSFFVCVCIIFFLLLYSIFYIHKTQIIFING